MKYALIIPDGCADEPQESLGGRTPLQAAEIPAMDAVAAAGVLGRANNTPPSLPPGSDVANLSLLGYNPLEHFTGRRRWRPPRRASPWGPHDWAARCNLVTIEDQVMRDFTAGHISTAEAAALLAHPPGNRRERTASVLPGRQLSQPVAAGSSGEDCPFSTDTRTMPPHDLTDQLVLDGYPRGPGSDLLNRLMSESVALFAEHPVNVARRQQGKLPATNVWLWGQGSTPALVPFQKLYGTAGGDDYGRRSAARAGPADRLAGDRRAGGHRLHRYRLCGQGALRGRGPQNAATWCAYTWRPPTRLRTKATWPPR